MITVELISAVRRQTVVNWHGIHGIHHWARVYENGLRLAEQNGAKKRVVQLFALFHDSCRRIEGNDPEHGPRGAELIMMLHERKMFQLDKDELKLLLDACRFHTTLDRHDDITIGTCFDSDRLDLGRVGKYPDKLLLSTDAAKDEKILSWAYQQSQSVQIPDNSFTRQAEQSR